MIPTIKTKRPRITKGTGIGYILRKTKIIKLHYNIINYNILNRISYNIL